MKIYRTHLVPQLVGYYTRGRPSPTKTRFHYNHGTVTVAVSVLSNGKRVWVHLHKMDFHNPLEAIEVARSRAARGFTASVRDAKARLVLEEINRGVR